MISIRLTRLGVRKKPYYRIIVVEKGTKKGGRNLDTLGFWHPAKNTKTIDLAKLKFWTQKGARLSKAVSKLISH
jgi:small subunit ribosomal protein S16